MVDNAFKSCFGRTFDLIAYGSGYAAFGAALEARRQGKSVLLVSRQSDLLWESGRAWAPGEPRWRFWRYTPPGPSRSQPRRRASEGPTSS